MADTQCIGGRGRSGDVDHCPAKGMEDRLEAAK